MRRHGDEGLSIGKGVEVPTVRARCRNGIECRGDGSLELVDAHPVWRARDHVLAGARRIGIQPDPVRPLRRTWPADALAASDDGTLEPDDTRGAGEVYGGDERTLRGIRVAGPWAGRIIRSR